MSTPFLTVKRVYSFFLPSGSMLMSFRYDSKDSGLRFRSTCFNSAVPSRAYTGRATNSDKTTTIILSMKTSYTCLSAWIGSIRDALKAGWRLAMTETVMTMIEIMRTSAGCMLA